MTTNRLRKLRITRVDRVAAGMNPEALALLAKSKSDADPDLRAALARTMPGRVDEAMAAIEKANRSRDAAERLEKHRVQPREATLSDAAQAWLERVADERVMKSAAPTSRVDAMKAILKDRRLGNAYWLALDSAFCHEPAAAAVAKMRGYDSTPDEAAAIEIIAAEMI